MKKVTILMSTYNGEKYLEDQLKSLLSQKNVNINILVRDDGSSDNTDMILNKYQSEGKLKWYKGDNIKPAWSFMDLIYRAPKSDYYAFCDQDDVWLDDKLYVALRCLEKCDIKKPCLYYGRPRLVDANLQLVDNPRASSHCMNHFSEAIINSNATGCTMVFNYKLLQVVKKKKPSYIDMHDGWIHKVCIIFNGNLFFDSDVHILYRQHENNVIGINKSLLKFFKQKFNSLSKKECTRSRVIESLYNCYSDIMSKDDKKNALLVINYDKSFMNRLKLLFCCRIKTKYFFRNICFRIAVLLKIF